MATEGQVARGPNGERAVFTNGQWVVAPAQAGPVALPADPIKQPQLRTAQTSATVAEGTAPTTIVRNEAPPGFMWVNPNDPSQGVRPIPGFTQPEDPTKKKARETRANRAGQTVLRAVTRAREELDNIFFDGSMVGEASAAARLASAGVPGTAASRFQQQIQDLSRNIGLDALQDIRAGSETGGGLGAIPVQQQKMLEETLGSFDVGQPVEVLRENLRQLNNIYLDIMFGTRGEREQLLASGQIDPERFQAIERNYEVTDFDEFGRRKESPLLEDIEQRSVFDQTFTDGGRGPQMNALQSGDVGGGRTASVPYPQEGVREHDRMVAELVAQGGGRIDPEAYARARQALDARFNKRGDPDAYASWANSVNEYLDSGGKTVPTGILPEEQLLSRADTLRNNLVNNPVGGAVAGLANMGGYGVPEMLAPDQFAALRDAQGLPMLAGDIGGAIGGTVALGALGRQTIGRAMPGLLGQAPQQGQGFARSILQGRADTAGQFGRNLATDATYGGIVGGTTQGEPLGGATLAGVGSGIGQGGSRLLGATVGGAQISDAAQLLRNEGVPISVGRQLGFGNAEDLLQSIPLAGGQARARQAESFVGFNEAGFNRAAQPATRLSNPIAPPAVRSGRDGVGDLQALEKQAYDSALAGVQSPVDGQWATDFADTVNLVRGLPGDYQTAASQVIGNRVAPAVNSGTITGRQYQQAVRGLRDAKSSAPNVGTTGFESEYVGALNSAEDALTGLIGRGNRPNVASDLKVANEIYSNRKILENASLDRARVGTRTGQVNVYSPSQLLDAARQAESRYGTGAALRELGEAGQQVLPSTVPNSGTTDRAIAASLLGGFGLGGGVIGAGAGASGAGEGEAMSGALSGGASGVGSGLGTAAALASALALLGTRGGQAALEAALINRPQALQNAGRAIRRQGGLFGSTGAAIGLQAQ
jgi:hypothetical protein